MDRWLDSLREIIENPAQNATVLATGIAIIVVFLIILVLLLIALTLPPHPKQIAKRQASLSRAARRPAWLSWLTGTILTIAGLAAATALWYAGTSSNTYCAKTCHAMAHSLETWSLSSHSSVNCVRCHEGRPWESMLRGVTMRGKCLYYQATGKSARGMQVPSSNCMECHANVIQKPLVARNGERFLHGEALTQNDDCTRCHGAQGHELPKP